MLRTCMQALFGEGGGGEGNLLELGVATYIWDVMFEHLTHPVLVTPRGL